MAKYKVVNDDVGKRADVFISRFYPDYSRSSLERLFDNGLIVAGPKAIKAGYRLKLGDVLAVDDSLLKKVPPKVDLPVLHEDDNTIVINKPAGLLTHSKGALNDEATVASFIASKLNDPALVGNRAGIVHRLDRGTSGVIITAKNSAALRHLQKQFSQRRTKKIYQAIIEGRPTESEAIIDAPIARNPKRPQTFYVNSRGKPAQTNYKVLSEFKRAGQAYSLVELNPTTGRTHQIRVHMKYIGHPIVGDRIYGHDAKHLYLHAQSLEITLPGGERKVFRADPPGYFLEFVNE